MTESPERGGRRQPATQSLRQGLQEFTLLVLAFSALTAVVTWPLVTMIGSAARLDNADGEFSVWNVAWVARTLVVDPLHVFDANIFYPSRGTLAYSEANLGAGFLAIPVYWATRNPYAAHNIVLLFSFVSSAAAMYYLARYLSGSRQAAAVAAIGFGYCPYVFGHLPHIQLLMTAGLPLGLLAFHRLSDAPSPQRGVALGVTMAAQAYFCAYYSIFLMLMIGYATLFVAVSRRLWTDRRYWSAVAIAALVAMMAVWPLLLPYIAHQRSSGFERSLADARMYAATWRTYLASSAFAHRWLLTIIGHWGELLFPGFVATIFGVAGAALGWIAGGRQREMTIFYGTLAIIAMWVSLGPDSGLYRLMYSSIPAFTFMRAPSRFGLIVVLSLCALSSLSIARLLSTLPGAATNTPFGTPLVTMPRRPFITPFVTPFITPFITTRRSALIAAIVGVAALGESLVPVRLPRVPPLSAAYRMLAAAPFGAVIELPVYSRAFAFKRADYMVNSTAHWKPLVNAYSDYTPPEFTARLNTIAEFPSSAAFAELQSICVRYAVFHLDAYGTYQSSLLGRLQEFAPRLRRLYGDDQTLLFEIVADPGTECGGRPNPDSGSSR